MLHKAAHQWRGSPPGPEGQGDIPKLRGIQRLCDNAVGRPLQNQLRQQTDSQPALLHGDNGVIIVHRVSDIRFDALKPENICNLSVVALCPFDFIQVKTVLDRRYPN